MLQSPPGRLLHLVTLISGFPVPVYTQFPEGKIIICEAFTQLNEIPACPKTSDGKYTIGSVMLREFTHLNAVYAPACEDLVSGYKDCTELVTQFAVMNADNFMLYADGLSLPCSPFLIEVDINRYLAISVGMEGKDC